MRGSSRTSLGNATEALEAVLPTLDGQALGQELFAVAGTFAGSASLRRTLTDPSRSGDGKAAAVQQFLSGKVSPAAVETIQGLVRQRWSEPADFVAAVEVLGVTSVLAAAERDNGLDQVSEELFRVERLLDAHTELQQAISDEQVPSDLRLKLVTDVLSDKARPETVALVRQAVRHNHRRSASTALAEFSELAAARTARSVARVESATPLGPVHVDRLRAALQRIYGRPIHVNVDVVPEVVGGIRIRVGDEVIDATTVSRLNDVRRNFAE